jgi:hypothetical protein
MSEKVQNALKPLVKISKKGPEIFLKSFSWGPGVSDSFAEPIVCGKFAMLN